MSGGPLPGVQITAKGVKSGFTRTTVSDTNGTYSIRLIPPADYHVDITLSGFQSVSSVVTVFTDRNTEFDATLKLSTLKESVSVSAELPVVDKTQTTTQGANVDSKSFTQKLAVARQLPVGDAARSRRDGRRGEPERARRPLSQNNVFLFDGVDTDRSDDGHLRPELQLRGDPGGQHFDETGHISAEYGRSQGAYVNVITKSGTNQLHGSVKLILTNDNWNAQNKGSDPQTGGSFAPVKYDKSHQRLGLHAGRAALSRTTSGSSGPTSSAKTTTRCPADRSAARSYQQTIGRSKLWQREGHVGRSLTEPHVRGGSGNGDPITGIVVKRLLRRSVTGRPARRSPARTRAARRLPRGAGPGRPLARPLSGEATVREPPRAASTSSRSRRRTRRVPSTSSTARTSRRRRSSAPHYDVVARASIYNGATFDGLRRAAADAGRPRGATTTSSSGPRTTTSRSASTTRSSSRERVVRVSRTTPCYYDDSFNYRRRGSSSPNERPDLRSAGRLDVQGQHLRRLPPRQDGLRPPLRERRLPRRQAGREERHRKTTVFDKTVFSPRLSFKFDLAGTGKTLVIGRLRPVLPVRSSRAFADGFAAVPQKTNYDRLPLRLRRPASTTVSTARTEAWRATTSPVNTRPEAQLLRRLHARHSSSRSAE